MDFSRTAHPICTLTNILQEPDNIHLVITNKEALNLGTAIPISSWIIFIIQSYRALAMTSIIDC